MPVPLQYEVSIPLSRVYTCYAALADKLYGPEQRWRGFRAPGLLRFVKEEPGLLSPTNGGPRAYINVEGALLLEAAAPGVHHCTGTDSSDAL
jgi:hypothetical protein